MAQDVKAMTVEEIKEAIKKRGKGIFIVFSSATIGNGKGIKHGTGRSSVAKEVAKRLNSEFLSTGEVFRNKAKEMNLDINKMQKYAKEHPELDVELDNAVVKQVKDAITRGKIIVADSNLLPYLIKDDIIRIAVDVDNNTRAKRVMSGARFGDKELETKEKTLEYLDSRSEAEQERYQTHPHEMYHNIDLNDQSMFYGVIDNSGLLEDTIKQALTLIKKKVVQ
jgi:cytidylate kinase